ncbi:hypothetical protein SLE2022_048140 [Rubroshorea leprosula]
MVWSHNPNGDAIRLIVFTKYPQYFNGLVEEHEQEINLDSLCINEEASIAEKKDRSPRSGSISSGGGPLDKLDRIQLEPSRLLDILTKKTSFPGNFISIPEIQARNRALKICGLSDDEYLVIFVPSYKDAMMMIGESHPFFRGNYYMTIIREESDCIRELAAQKESRVIPAPETWLDLRIKGSQASQYFRRKCKHTPNGLFSYSINVNGIRYSAHWISEAHWNSWHVLLDATGLDFGQERVALAHHRPDFVLCMLDGTHAEPSKKLTCLMVRRSFDTTSYLA